MRPIYLDHNATTPVDPRVLDIYITLLKEEGGNPSSVHFYGQKAKQKLEQSRQAIARFFKVKPQEIIFTSGGTEGAALLIQGIMQKYPDGHIISSNFEHACVYQTLHELKKRGNEVTFLSGGLEGMIRPHQVEQAIHANTRLITLMGVNNETGVMTDIEAIAKIAHRANIPFVVDGVAWLGKERIFFSEGMSAVFFSGHKINALKGTGFCVCRNSLKLAPLFIGGGQEFGRRAGTENLCGIIALAEAITLLEKDQELVIARMQKLRDYFEKSLISQLPNVLINGSGPRASNTSNLAFLGVDGETLLINLDFEKIYASHGSACSSGALEPSRILLEMGIPLSQVRSSLRFSIGTSTTLDEIERAISIIIRVVNDLRAKRIKSQ